MDDDAVFVGEILKTTIFLKINRVSIVQKSKTKEVWEQRIGIQFQWVINHP